MCLRPEFWRHQWHSYGVDGAEEYLEEHLKSFNSFSLKYDGETRMMRVKHDTLGCYGYSHPKVKVTALEPEIADEGVVPDSQEFDDACYARRKAWETLVKCRTWTAACSNDWNMWPLEKIRSNSDLRWLFVVDGCEKKKKGDKIDHIVDLSTLTLLQD